MALRLARRVKAKLPIDREVFLSLLGGLESGVMTTTAIVIGLIISEHNIQIAIVAAYVTVTVQAFNAAASRYVGLRASQEIDDLFEQGRFRPFMNALIQFGAHALASFIPIIPLYYSVEANVIVFNCVALAYVTMLIIGLFQGLFLKIQAKQNMIEILATGTLVILVGTAAGLLLQ